MAASILQPCFSRSDMCINLMPGTPHTSAHSAIVRRLPRHSSQTLLLLFLACSVLVAHLTFPGSYGPLLSGNRSMVYAGDGRGPTSAKKFSKECSHLSQTVMPRPPYPAYASLFGLKQRLFIDDQMLYMGVSASPCVSRDFVSATKQPQDFVRSVSNIFATTKVVLPHWQRHSHGRLMFPFGDTMRSPLRITVNLPNTRPISSAMLLVCIAGSSKPVVLPWEALTRPLRHSSYYSIPYSQASPELLVEQGIYSRFIPLLGNPKPHNFNVLT